jgi:hypothetical protein
MMDLYCVFFIEAAKINMESHKTNITNVCGMNYER